MNLIVVGTVREGDGHEGLGQDLARRLFGNGRHSGDHRRRYAGGGLTMGGVMNKWRDFRRAMATELLLFTYTIAWGGVLLVTYMLTK